MIKQKTWIVGGSIVLLALGGGAIYAHKRKKKKEQQDEGYQKFRDQLEHREEPEKIKRAVLQQAFDPDYWKSVSSRLGHSLISAANAKKLAQKIKAAWNAGIFWDDLEEKVYEAFENTKLKTYADVSRMADAYRSKEVAGEELWGHLKYKLSEDEFAKVKSIVIQKKPL